MLAHGILASVAGEEQFQLLQVALHHLVGVSLVAYLHEVKTYRLLYFLHDGHGGDVLHARLEEMVVPITLLAVRSAIMAIILSRKLSPTESAFTSRKV